MEASRSFPADVNSPRAARQFVCGLLTDPDAELSLLAEVLTSELVTNAVVHARTRLGVKVELDGGHMRVEVTDGDSHLPCPAPPAPDSPDALGGRGLYLVQQLASAWGSDACPDGKVVWFTLDSARLAPTAPFDRRPIPS